MELPGKDELRGKQRMFLLGLSEQLQESSKIWFIILAVFVILAWPAKAVLQKSLAAYFIGAYQPRAVTESPYNPEALVVVKTGLLAVAPGIYSAYAQIRNPNAELSARAVSYRFLFRGAGAPQSFSGETYLLAGQSRFVLLAAASLSSSPESVDLVFDGVTWVRRVPAFQVKFDVLQKNTGRSAEGGTFVEFLVKNPQGYRIKKVDVQAIVFGRAGQEIFAVNSGQFTDLKPFESRYVRLVWPAALPPFGEIQILPQVNQLEPGAVLDTQNKIPAR